MIVELKLNVAVKRGMPLFICWLGFCVLQLPMSWFFNIEVES